MIFFIQNKKCFHINRKCKEKKDTSRGSLKTGKRKAKFLLFVFNVCGGGFVFLANIDWFYMRRFIC